MPPLAIGLVLLSAALHAVWNGFARAQAGDLRSMWLIPAGGGLAGLLYLNAGALHVPFASLGPFVMASSVIHAFYFYFLGSSYASSELTWAYSVSRGLALLLTAPLALLLFDQVLPGSAWIGVVLVAAGLFLMHLDGLRSPNVDHRRALPRTIAVGVLATAYSLVDSQAVRHGPPLDYITLVLLGATLLLAPFALRVPAAPRPWVALMAGAVSLVSYLLMLMSYRVAPVAAALAVRQVAPIFAALVGWVALRERPARTRLSGTAMIVLGAVLATAR